MGKERLENVEDDERYHEGVIDGEADEKGVCGRIEAVQLLLVVVDCVCVDDCEDVELSLRTHDLILLIP